MANELHYNTITPSLKAMLFMLMGNPLFDRFTLVGGTNLSLRYGHRRSVDIDLFTDADYNTIDFSEIDSFFREEFPFCLGAENVKITGLGESYFAGKSKDDAVKVDLYYTDAFIRPVERIEGIRMAAIEDIIAMKVDAISRKGRKKDFWDLHFLLDDYGIDTMIELHKERYPWSHNGNEIYDNFADFDKADDDPDPDCFHGKIWELIKLNFYELVNRR